MVKEISFYWIITTEKLVHANLPLWAFRKAGKPTISFITSVCPYGKNRRPLFQVCNIAPKSDSSLHTSCFEVFVVTVVVLLCFAMFCYVSPSFNGGIVSYNTYILIKIKVDSFFGIIYFVDFVHHLVLRNKSFASQGQDLYPSSG